MNETEPDYMLLSADLARRVFAKGESAFGGIVVREVVVL